ncbi:hypothetical protein [Streptomyces platensis]|uniref:hypothetical protein n=1 Tax=Streptomyces platensis TaxID=58346 RepID=UPI00332C4629
MGESVLGGGEVLAGDAAGGVLGGLERHHAHLRAMRRSLSLMRFMRPPVAGDRPFDLFDDVDEVFEIPGLADKPRNSGRRTIQSMAPSALMTLRF